MRTVFLRRPTGEELATLGRAKRFLLVWLPVLIGILVIAAESTPTFSATNTSAWLRPILQRIFGPISNHRWGNVHHLLRKCGHFLGYGTLCVLFLRAWLLSFAGSVGLRMGAWRLQSWAFAVVSTVAVASGDELHQTFLPSRTGMFSDVVLDTCGGIVVSGAVLGLNWWIGGMRASVDMQRAETAFEQMKL